MGMQIRRLTWEKPNGEWGLDGYDIKKAPLDLYPALYKLHQYEGTGLSPEQLEDLIELRELIVILARELGIQKSDGADGGQCLEAEEENMEQGWKGYFVGRFGKVE